MYKGPLPALKNYQTVTLLQLRQRPVYYRDSHSYTIGSDTLRLLYQ